MLFIKYFHMHRFKRVYSKPQNRSEKKYMCGCFSVKKQALKVNTKDSQVTKMGDLWKEHCPCFPRPSLSAVQRLNRYNIKWCIVSTLLVIWGIHALTFSCLISHLSSWWGPGQFSEALLQTRQCAEKSQPKWKPLPCHCLQEVSMASLFQLR